MTRRKNYSPSESQMESWALFVIAGAIKNLELLHVRAGALPHIHEAVKALRAADAAIRESLA